MAYISSSLINSETNKNFVFIRLAYYSLGSLIDLVA